MDTVVATEADATRCQGAKFKLSYRQIYELSVAKARSKASGRGIAPPRPHTPVSPTACWMGTKGPLRTLGSTWVPPAPPTKSWLKARLWFVAYLWGSVTDIGPEQAYELARRKLAVVRETGEYPSKKEA